MTAVGEQRELSFGATRRAFAAALARQRLGGASLSVTVQGTEVLNLAGGLARPGRAFTPDTRAIVMSVSKGFTGLVIAMLADRGLIDPDERVAAYWPEFGAHGKADVLVRHLLLHTAGVLGLPDVPAVLSWDGRGWHDLDAIAAALASATPAWSPGTRRGYHAVTYGWLLGELVRRTDGRTLGRFFREEVAGPLGLRSAIGVPEPEQDDIATVHPEGMDDVPLVLRRMHRRMQRGMRDPATLLGQASLGDGTHSIFDTPGRLLSQPWWISAEVPASNGASSARDLARLFALIAHGGELDGVRLLSQETLATFLAPQPTSADVVMTSFLGPVLRKALRADRAAPISLGFAVNGAAGRFGPNPRTVGAGGYGGQFVLADPDRQLSIGFVRSGLLRTEKELTAQVTAVYEDLTATG